MEAAPTDSTSLLAGLAAFLAGCGAFLRGWFKERTANKEVAELRLEYERKIHDLEDQHRDCTDNALIQARQIERLHNDIAERRAEIMQLRASNEIHIARIAELAGSVNTLMTLIGHTAMGRRHNDKEHHDAN